MQSRAMRGGNDKWYAKSDSLAVSVEDVRIRHENSAGEITSLGKNKRFAICHVVSQ